MEQPLKVCDLTENHGTDCNEFKNPCTQFKFHFLFKTRSQIFLIAVFQSHCGDIR